MPIDSLNRSRMTNDSIKSIGKNKSKSFTQSSLKPYCENVQSVEYEKSFNTYAQEQLWDNNEKWWWGDTIKKVSEKFENAKQIYEKQILELKVLI